MAEPGILAKAATAKPSPDFSQKYNTPVPVEKRAAYQKWLAALPRQLQSPADYDIQGAFVNGTGADARAHMTDQFKKPNHPTFSNQSQWDGIDGYSGGQWIDGAGKTGYQPSNSNIEMHGATGLQDYFRQVEPKVSLASPVPQPIPTGSGGVYRVPDLAAYGDAVNQQANKMRKQ